MTAPADDPAARAAAGGGGRQYRWVVVGITFFSTAMVLGARFSMGMFIPFLPEAFATSPAAVSGVLGITLLVAAVAQPVIGWLLDRFGARLVFTTGLALSGAALCGTAMADQFWQFLALFAIGSALGYAALSPASTTTILTGWFDRQKGTAVGIATSGTKVAMILMPPAIAAMIVAGDWRFAMMVVGGLILLMIPVVLLFMRDAAGLGSRRARPEKPGGTDLGGAEPVAGLTTREALAMPAFWIIVVTFIANGLTMNLVFVHLPSFLLEQGYDTQEAASGLALLAGIGILGTIVTGWLSDKLGPALVLLVMYGVRAVTTLLVLLEPSPVTFAIFGVTFGLLGYGSIAVIGALTTDSFGRRSIGTIIGLAYVFNQIGGATGAFAGGASLAWTGGFDAALWLAIVSTALAMPGIWYLWHRGRA